WKKLLQDYPNFKDYLIKFLRCNSQSWVYAFTSKYFTAGIQSISCNDSENSTLKWFFGGSNLSLSDNPANKTQNAAKSIFKSVVKQLNKFVMLNVIKKQKKQINLRLYYYAVEIDFEVVRSMEKHWYKDVLQGTNILNSEFVVISLNKLVSKTHSLLIRFLQSSNLCKFNTNQIKKAAISDNKIFKAILKKCKFGELWDLRRKIMIGAIENKNKDNYHELLEFFSSIQRRSFQRIINDNYDLNINNSNVIMDIQNPVKRKLKGHPKTKRIKSIIEESNIKT
ncbi:14633_t:CDS:2, partial [Funneliformis mosseae]